MSPEILVVVASGLSRGGCSEVDWVIIYIQKRKREEKEKKKERKRKEKRREEKGKREKKRRCKNEKK